MKKFNLMAMVLAVLILSVSGWGACTQSQNGYKPYSSNKGFCKGDPTWGASYPLCSSTAACGGPIEEGGLFYYECDVPYGTGSMCNDGNFGTTLAQKNWVTCVYRCNSQSDVDSISCFLQGNIWQDGSCKENHCKAADTTWLTTSIASCSGSNNYALVNTDSTCEHVGTCCSNDSIPSGNSCKWRCDSVLTTCNSRTGDLFGGVLPDTSVSGQDTTFSYQCYYNCSHSPNPDSTVYLVEGNIVLGGPSDSIPDGIKSQTTFNSVRTETGGVYVYDYLSPAASEYIDSIAAMKCVEHLWRCVINSKYVYWYDNQEVPAGCTNIVRVK